MSHSRARERVPTAGYESERLDAARLFEDLPPASSPPPMADYLVDLVESRPPARLEPPRAAPTVKIRRTPPGVEPRVVAFAIVGVLAFLGAAAACSHSLSGAPPSPELATHVAPR